jgi:uncharacterized protein (DUF2384 family)
MSDQATSSGNNHWQRRRRTANPLPRDQAIRQGEITRVAFRILGREDAITFLNSNNALLGGRPIALATESVAGQLHVEAELGRLQERLRFAA